MIFDLPSSGVKNHSCFDAIQAILQPMYHRKSLFVRSLGFGLLSLAISSGGSVAVAQDLCGCNRGVPYPGSYQIGFPEKTGQPAIGGANVAVSDLGGVLGALISVTAPGGGSLALECRPDGAFTGFMQPRNQPSRIPATGIGALGDGIVGVDGNVPTGLSMVSEFNVIVVRPGQASVANEVMQPSLMFSRVGGAGQMPPEMCARVDNFIRSSENFLQAYSNADLIQDAMDDGISGLNDGDQMWPDYDRVSARTVTNVNITYDQRVKIFADPNTVIVDGDAVSETSEQAASMDTQTCEITPPSERDSNGQCRLAIEIDAIMAHELDHQANCNRVKGLTQDDDGYRFWSNYPPNHSAIEVEGYLATLDVLIPWYGANCSG